MYLKLVYQLILCGTWDMQNFTVHTYTVLYIHWVHKHEFTKTIVSMTFYTKNN